MAVSGVLGAIAPVISPPSRRAAGPALGERAFSPVVDRSNTTLDLHVPISAPPTPRANGIPRGHSRVELHTVSHGLSDVTLCVRRRASTRQSEGAASLCLWWGRALRSQPVRRAPLDCPASRPSRRLSHAGAGGRRPGGGRVHGPPSVRAGRPGRGP